MEGVKRKRELKDEQNVLMVYYCLQDGGHGKKFLAEAMSFLVSTTSKNWGWSGEGLLHTPPPSAELHSVHGMGKSCSHSDSHICQSSQIQALINN